MPHLGTTKSSPYDVQTSQLIQNIYIRILQTPIAATRLWIVTNWPPSVTQHSQDPKQGSRDFKDRRFYIASQVERIFNQRQISLITAYSRVE